MSTLPTDEWERRVTAARFALDDSGSLVELERARRRIRAEASPAIEMISGAPLLLLASRVGILSGSFNPLTAAHAALGSAALGSAALGSAALGSAALGASGLAALVWCCATATIDKQDVTRAALADRLAQVRSYASSEAGAAVAVVNRGLYVDQATLLRGLVDPGAEVVIVVGFDKAVQIFDAHYYDERDAALTTLFAAARLLVAPRAGDDEAQLQALLARPENMQYAERVAYLDVPTALRNDSSTEARAVAAAYHPGAAVSPLRHLLAPEGYALATTDSPYAQVTEDADAYRVRSRWIGELARFDGVMPRPLPHLHVLVAASLRTDEVGGAIRWLLRSSEDSEEPASLLKALDQASHAR